MTTDNWPFPWPRAQTPYDKCGPDKVSTVDVHGINFLVTPTGDEGIHTGRPRYRVVCMGCSQLIHENTTSPPAMIRGHLRRHGKEVGW